MIRTGSSGENTMEWQRVDGSFYNEWILTDDDNNPLVTIGWWEICGRKVYRVYHTSKLSFLYETYKEFSDIRSCKKHVEKKLIEWVKSILK
jgi:hypothetical protein